jgi:hypothetical protein
MITTVAHIFTPLPARRLGKSTATFALLGNSIPTNRALSALNSVGLFRYWSYAESWTESVEGTGMDIQQNALDTGYIRLKLKGFDELLETSELSERYEAIETNVRKDKP